MTGSFVDPDDADVQTFDWKVVAPGNQAIPDGTAQTFTFTPEEAGTYTVTFKITDQNGGDITTTLQFTATGGIVSSGASTTVLAAPEPVVYGQAATFTATVMGYGTPTGTVTFYTGEVNPDDELGTGTLGVVDGQDIATFSTSSLTVSGGPYTIIAVYGGDANNQGSSSNPISQVITPAPLTITAQDVSGTYGSVSLNGTTGFTESGLITGDSISGVTLSTNATLSSSGNYNYSATPWTITPSDATGSGLTNYSITYDTAPNGLTISKLNITAALNGAVEEKTYDGTTSAALGSDYTLYTPVTDDVVTLSATGTYDTQNAGSGKTVTFTNLAMGGLDAGDYNLTSNSLSDANGKIDTAALTITAKNVSGTYGSVSLSGTTGFTESGLITGDSISGVTLSTNATLSSSGNYNYSATPWTITPSDATGSGLTNYSITYDTAPNGLTISKLNITAALNGAVEEKTYDGTTSAALGNDYTLSTLVTDDVVTLSATGTYDTQNAGSGKTVTYTNLALGGLDAGDYNLTNTSLSDANGEIDTAALAITAKDVSGTYGSVSLSGTTGFTESGLITGELISGVTLSTNATLSSSGNYNYSATPWTITPSDATGSGLTNYSITYDTAPNGLTISKLNITAALNGAVEEKTYDGTTSAALGSDYTLYTPVTDDVVTLSATGTYDTQNAGSGKTVTFTNLAMGGLDAGDYNLTSNSLSDANGKIDTAALTITAKNVSGTYGSVSLSGTTGFTESGLITGDSISAVTLTTNATLSSSGNYNYSATPLTITPSNATGSGLSNYSITYDTAPNGLTISKLNITAALNGAVEEKTYDGTTSAALGSDYTLSTLVTDDVVTLSATGTYDTQNAGSGKTVTFTNLALGGLDAGDYNLTNTSLSDANGKIDTAALTITAKNVSGTYGSVSLSGTTGFTESGLVSGDSISAVTLTTNATLSSSGNYNYSATPLTITPSNATGSGLSNYSITYDTAPNGLTISKLNITAALNGAVEEKTYDGTTSAALGSDYTLSTLVTDDVVTLSATGTYDTQNAGSGKTVTYTNLALGGLDAGDYNLTNTSLSDAHGKIDTAALTITAKNVSGTYGSVSLSGTTGFTESGLVSGDSISAVTLTTNATLSSSGNYNYSATPLTITPSNATGSGLSNYTIVYANAATGLTISKLNITAALNGAVEEKTYDGTTSAALGNDYTLSTPVAGDFVTMSATGNYDTKNAGSGKTVTYTNLALGGLDAGDYNLTNTSLSDAHGKIDTAALTITAKNVSGTYGSVSLSGTTGFTESGLVSGDSISAVTLTTNATLSSSGNYNYSATPLTITPSNATGSGLTNYSITYDTAPNGLTISKLNITAALNGAVEEKTYDGTTSAALGNDYTLSTLVTDDVVTLSATGTYDTQNAGSGKTVTYTNLALGGLDAGDYNLTNTSLSDAHGKIDTAALTITAKNVSGTYGSVSLSGTTGFTESGLVSGDSISAVTLTTNATLSSSGNYNYSATPLTITPSNATGSGLSNYTIVYANAATGLTISKLNITAALNGAVEEKTYDGTTSAALGNDYTLSTPVAGDFVTMSATGNYDTKNAGSGKTVTYTNLALGGLDAGDYNLTNTSLSDAHGKIDTAALTITAKNVSGTYGSVSLSGTTGFTESGLVSGDSISSVVLSTNATVSSSGNYNYSATQWTITPSDATGSGLTNYSITYDTAPNGLTVSKLNITAALNGAVEQKTYDGTTTATLGSDYTLSAPVTGDVVTLSATGNYNNKNVGSGKTVTYTNLILGGVDSGDYNLTTSSLSDSNGKIIAAPLAITANNVSGTYGSVSLNGTTGFTESGLVSGDSISGVILTTNATLSSSGNYNYSATPWTITPSAATGSGLTNYSITYDAAPVGLTISKLSITAALNGAVEQKTYDGTTTATLGSDYTLSTPVSGDVVTLSATGNYNNKNVGSGKTVTYTNLVLGGVDSGDYNLTTSSLSDSNGKIIAAPLAITANNVSGTYGSVSLSGTTGFTESGLISGDSISGVTLSTNATLSSSGNYNYSATPWTITPSAATGSGLSNYSITYKNGTLTVNTAPLTITANNASKVYGQANPAPNVSYSGFVTGESSSSLTTLPTASTTATITSPVGTYAITVSGAVDPNYSFTYVAGTLTINKDTTTTAATTSTTSGSIGQTVTITATVTANAPGSGTPTGSVDFFDTTTSVDLGSVALSGGAASLSTTALSSGTHAITVTYSGDSNFLTSSAATSTITMGQSLIVLDPTAGGALSISGNASIKLTGGVYVDSSSSSAILASGNAAINAAVIDVHGSVSKSGNASFSPAAVTKAAVVNDPLSGLAVPSETGLTNYGSYSLSGNSTATIKSGIYSAIAVSGNASLTMSAGIYIITGGGFSVSGNASVTGTGVTIYNTNSAFPSSGGTSGAITLSGNGTFKLTPATTGTYANLLFIQPAANTHVLTYSGNAMAGVSGTIYAPSAGLVESGDAQLNASIIVDTITLSGNAITNVATLSAPDGAVAYSPAQVRSAYGVSSLTTDGSGQTIALVDAYDNPDIYPAVDAFDTQFGLTDSGPSLYDQYGPASSFLTVIGQDGQSTSLPASDPNGPGTDNWEVEESLDVEWAHAIAPGAKIVLVEANSQSLSDLMAAVATAAGQPGVSVVSMSWGFAEGQSVSASDEATYDAMLDVPGVSFVASTGDYGAADPEYPAYSPNVLAVGGTTLDLNNLGAYDHELGWGNVSGSQGTVIGSGGGISQFEPEPSYQQGVQATGGRTTPDVSLVADPATGAWIADPYNLADSSSPFEVVGGTSLSAPAWAGLLALVNQGREVAGQPVLNSTSPTEVQQALYSLPQSDYNVITSGNNGYDAESGYNLVTGLGTPIANLLVSDLVAYQGAGTAYSGAKVGPLQDATLDGQVSGEGSETDVINVFDSLTITAAGQGHAPLANQGAGSASFQDQTVTTVVSEHTAVAASNATVLIFAPFAAGANTQSFAFAGPSVAAVPQAERSSHVVPQSSINRTGSLPQFARDLANACDRSALFAAALSTARELDSDLDELAAGLVAPAAHTAASSVEAPRVAVSWLNGVRPKFVAGPEGAAGLAKAPAGPLGSREPDRPQEQPSKDPAEIFLVGGFCGFGAGLLLGGKSAARRISARLPFGRRQRGR